MATAAAGCVLGASVASDIWDRDIIINIMEKLMATYGTITVSVVDGKEWPPEAVDKWRVAVQEIVTKEAGIRLLRQLKGATGLDWTLTQTPKPRGLDCPPPMSAADRKKHADEVRAYMEQRKLARQQGHEYAAAARRLEQRGLVGPSQQQVHEEMDRARREAAEAQHAAERTTRSTSTTDKAVKKILERKAAQADA